MNAALSLCSKCSHSLADTALFCPSCGTARVRDLSSADGLIGKTLADRFLVQERIGHGGSGTIYRAEHVTLRRKVAIKVLHAEMAKDDLSVERFRREATSVSQLDNDHIVEVLDFGRTPDGRLYLAMELLEGKSLEEDLRQTRQSSIEDCVEILQQVGDALATAHAAGLVHRDIRPRNIFLTQKRGRRHVKLLDFGLAKLVENDAHAASTSLGLTFGDPKYMSPEQARGERIDQRADIYQLGCVAYEMLTGAPPFAGQRVFDILTKHVGATPAPIPSVRRETPLWLEATVTRMLAKQPDDRFATVTRMSEALAMGAATGAVMDETRARRVDTTPPPEVVRVLERRGESEATKRPDAMRTQLGIAPGAVLAADPAPMIAPPVAPTVASPAVPTTASAAPPSTTSVPSAPIPAAVQPAIPVSTPAAAAVAPPGESTEFSQKWFDEERKLADSSVYTRPKRGRLTDSELDLDRPPGNRRGRAFAIGAVLLLAGGAAVFALTRSGESGKTTATQAPQVAPASAPTDPAAAAATTPPPAPVASTAIAPTQPASQPVAQPTPPSAPGATATITKAPAATAASAAKRSATGGNKLGSQPAILTDLPTNKNLNGGVSDDPLLRGVGAAPKLGSTPTGPATADPSGGAGPVDPYGDAASSAKPAPAPTPAPAPVGTGSGEATPAPDGTVDPYEGT